MAKEWIIDDKRQKIMIRLGLEADQEDKSYANDINYFTKNSMSEHYIQQFYENLPYHLKSVFIGVYPAKVKASFQELQEYMVRTNHGLTEVSFWYGVDWRFHRIPLLGSIAIGIVRVLEDTKWKTLYFDAELGKCLGSDREKAAMMLNERGESYYQAGLYQKALEYFKNAKENTVNFTSFNAVFLSNQALALIGLLL